MSLKFKAETRVWNNLISRMRKPFEFLSKCAENQLSNPVIEEKSNEAKVWINLCLSNDDISVWLDQIISKIPSLALLYLEKGFDDIIKDQSCWKKILDFYKSWVKYTGSGKFNDVVISDEALLGSLRELSSSTLWDGNFVLSTAAREILKKSKHDGGQLTIFDNDDDDLVKYLTFWNVDSNIKLIVGITGDGKQFIFWDSENGRFLGAVASEDNFIFSLNNNFLFMISDELDLSEFKLTRDDVIDADELITLEDKTIAGFPDNFVFGGYKIIEVSVESGLITVVRKKKEFYEIVQIRIPLQRTGDKDSYFYVVNIKKFTFKSPDVNLEIKCRVELGQLLLLSYGKQLFVRPIEKPQQKRLKTTKWSFEKNITCMKMFIDVILLGFENGKVGIQKFRYVGDMQLSQISYTEVQVDDHKIEKIHIDTIEDKPFIIAVSDYSVRRLLIPQ